LIDPVMRDGNQFGMLGETVDGGQNSWWCAHRCCWRSRRQSGSSRRPRYRWPMAPPIG
jgi:hypothetical protein